MNKGCFFNHRDVTLETFESDISENTRSPLSPRPCLSLPVITKVITDLTGKNHSFVPEVLRLCSSPLAFINLISILVPHVQAGKIQIPPLSCTSHKLITKTNVQKSINPISHTIHRATVDSYSFDPSVQQETDFHSDPGNNTSSPHVFLSLSVSCKNHNDPCDLVGMGQSIRALVLKIRMQCLDARSSISRAWHWVALLVEKTISQPYIGSSFTELACRNTALSFSLGKM